MFRKIKTYQRTECCWLGLGDSKQKLWHGSERSEPNLAPQYRGLHHEHSTMTKSQVCSDPIKNCKCQRTGYLCKTCKDRGSLDKYGDCTCCINCGGSQIGNSCNCCKVCGEPKDFCPGCCNACKEVLCECICSYCQQSSCICCGDCRKYPCTCEQHCRQCEKEEDNCVCCQKCRQLQCDCCKTCQQIATNCLCCSVCYQQVCVCCRNCRKPDCGVCCPRCLQRKTSCDCCQRCQATKKDCNCSPKAQEQARTPELTTPSAMSSVEPPDMSILRDRSQLDF